MEKPIRVQRKRTKGWRKPENTVIVTRPYKWGNPYKVGEHGTNEECVELFIKHFIEKGLLEKAIKELRGKNLACWCHPWETCHADYLLKVVN